MRNGRIYAVAGGISAAVAFASTAEARPIAEIRRDMDALRREARAALAQADAARLQAEADAAAARALLAELDDAEAAPAPPAPAPAARAPVTLAAKTPAPAPVRAPAAEAADPPAAEPGDASEEEPGEEPAAGAAEAPAAENTHDRLSQEALRESKDGRANFGGIDFGIGLSFSYDLGGERRVRDASVVNGLVRVTQADNARARLILESHYLFTPNGRIPFGLTNRNCLRLSGERIKDCVPQREWGFGPFVALQPGSGAIIDAVGAGLMVGFRRPGEGNDSFNFGIGMLYDLNVRVLGPGIFANEPLPLGETEIRYQEREQASLLFLTSFTF